MSMSGPAMPALAVANRLSEVRLPNKVVPVLIAASVAAVSCCAADSIADDDVDSGTIRRLHLAAGASTPAYLVK